MMIIIIISSSSNSSTSSSSTSSTNSTSTSLSLLPSVYKLPESSSCHSVIVFHIGTCRCKSEFFRSARTPGGTTVSFALAPYHLSDGLCWLGRPQLWLVLSWPSLSLSKPSCRISRICCTTHAWLHIRAWTLPLAMCCLGHLGWLEFFPFRPCVSRKEPSQFRDSLNVLDDFRWVYWTYNRYLHEVCFLGHYTVKEEWSAWSSVFSVSPAQSYTFKALSLRCGDPLTVLSPTILNGNRKVLTMSGLVWGRFSYR